ncbi:retrovirus-related pol polyprotein from transposon TNT 1-94 [Tanacetum coccineum]
MLLCTLSSTTNSKALRKALYGLKQAPRAWYDELSNFLMSKGFSKAFSDVEHAECIDTRKSTSGGIQFLGDKLVSKMSKKQYCTAISSTEAQYVALSASCAQVMWMRTQLKVYGFNYNKILLYYDSQSAIAISCKAVHHSHTKHIHTRHIKELCLLCEWFTASILALQFCLGTCLDHLGRRHELGELWDCQLGNFTAGKDSGWGENDYPRGCLGLQGKAGGEETRDAWELKWWGNELYNGGG